MTREEALHDMGREAETKDQVNKFLHCCLNLLSNIDVA
jgi:hypothetical protein